MIGLAIFTIGLGGFIGFIASEFNWSAKKTALVSFVVGFFLLPLWQITAWADNPISSLRENTVHLDGGTGFIAVGRSGQHYLVTNWHVCLVSEWKGTLNASRESGERITGAVVKENPVVDLCAAQISPQKRALHIGGGLQLGQQLWTRGYPSHILTESTGYFKGLISWGYRWHIGELGQCPKGFTVERGINGRIQGCSTVYRSNLSDLYSRPGSSGSPVVDANGDLVGVVSSLHPDVPTEAGLVPYNDLKKFLEAL